MKQTSTNTTNLWQLKSGERAKLQGFAESLSEAYQDRVFELGFRPGVEVHCIKAPAFGAPRVYRVNNSVFSLENSIAGNILLEA